MFGIENQDILVSVASILSIILMIDLSCALWLYESPTQGLWSAASLL